MRLLLILAFIVSSQMSFAQTDLVAQAPTLELQKLFSELPRENQIQFLENRALIMSKLQLFLNKSEPVIRSALFVKGAFAKATRFVLGDYKQNLFVLDNTIVETDRVPRPPLDPKYSLPAKQQSEMAIQSILQSTDINLWSQAPLVANANEYSFAAAAAVQAEGGTTTKGWGGLFDIGFSVGFNKDTKAVFFQLFKETERFETTMIKAVAVGGVVLKAGPRISSFAQKSTGEGHGKSFYPPMVPGFQSTTENSYWFGFSSGLTVPPSPIGDMLTYTNSVNHQPFLRISFSPLFKGLMRLEIDPVTKALRFVKDSAKNLALRLNRNANISGPRCEALF